jgi:hypothetical protein
MALVTPKEDIREDSPHLPRFCGRNSSPFNTADY